MYVTARLTDVNFDLSYFRVMPALRDERLSSTPTEAGAPMGAALSRARIPARYVWTSESVGSSASQSSCKFLKNPKWFRHRREVGFDRSVKRDRIQLPVGIETSPTFSRFSIDADGTVLTLSVFKSEKSSCFYSNLTFLKVDRSAAYAARWVAKSLVKARLCKRCLVQVKRVYYFFDGGVKKTHSEAVVNKIWIFSPRFPCFRRHYHEKCSCVKVSYAIGVAKPLSVMVMTYGTSELTERDLLEIVQANFDLRPGMITK